MKPAMVFTLPDMGQPLKISLHRDGDVFVWRHPSGERYTGLKPARNRAEARRNVIATFGAKAQAKWIKKRREPK